MQLRKLLFADNEKPVHTRQHLRSEYLEGRGLYPEKRGHAAGRAQYDTDYDDQPEYTVVLHDDHSLHHNANDSWDLDRYPDDILDHNFDHNPDQGMDQSMDYNPGFGQRESGRQVAGRRSPLTMLEVLVQIKMNGLAHGNA